MTVPLDVIVVGAGFSGCRMLYKWVEYRYRNVLLTVLHHWDFPTAFESKASK